MHDLGPRYADAASPQQQHHRLHKRVLHRRAAATTETTTTTTATHARTTTTTTSRVRTTATTASATVVESAAALAASVSSTSSSFQPGVAASGTATKSVGNSPPTRSRTHTSASYTFSFAVESSGLPQSTSVAANSSSAATTGLPTGAIYGIAIGGGVLGVLILAGIGWYCWKKRKSGNEDKWTSLGDAGREGPSTDQPVELRTVGAWTTNDSLGGGPYQGGDKPWAQESFSSLASYDEKSQGTRGHALPVFAPRNHEAARRELLGAPAARYASERSFPRSATEASLASVPDGPNRTRQATGTGSVNGVIIFGSDQPAVQPAPGTADADPLPAHLPTQSSPFPASPPARGVNTEARSWPEEPVRAHLPTTHHSLNGVPVGPQPITARDYPPRRPMRPSEVPSVGAASISSFSPYAFARRPEQAQRDTRELASDRRLENRFMDVMTGRVGHNQDESPERRPAQSKKDTIIGLTDAYGGQEVTDDEEDEERDEVDKLPSPPSAAAFRSSPPSNTRRYSSRVDSKPLRELEAMFEQLPPASQHYGVRSSEASDLSGLAAAAGVRLGGGSSQSTSPSYRASNASSMFASAHGSSSNGAPTGPLAFTRRPLGPVPESSSQDSLSPLSAATVASGSAARSPHGEEQHEHAHYPAVGVDKVTVASNATSSPTKQHCDQAGMIGHGDVFGPTGGPIEPPARQSSVKASLQRKVSTRPAAPGPLRLARNASLAHTQGDHLQKDPLTPSPSTERKNPLTLSMAEREVLDQLGLPGTPELSSSALSSPDSSLGSSALATPQTPVFHLTRPSTHDVGEQSFMELSPSPSPSRDAYFAPHHQQQVKAPRSMIVDPSAFSSSTDAYGFESLTVMAGKQGQQDASYRSATMSLYGMYE